MADAGVGAGIEPATLSLLAKCAFPVHGTKVTCAVSGGADSMSLMALAAAAGCIVAVVHVDHGLRPGSDKEAKVVEEAANRFGATFRSETIDVPAGPNLEARARDARYAVLPDNVMTGHTADDQAETVLINLMRGASSTGLAAMRPGPRRPILALRRAETVRFCREAGITTVDDPSNREPIFLRNRVRHELLPLMIQLAGRDLVPVLTRQADLLRDDSDLLDELAAALDPTDAKQLAAAPLPLARRAVRRWLTTEHPPDAATVERVLQVAGGQAAGCDLGAGRRVERSHQRLQLLGEPSATPSR
ncbi:MAG: tRNA lysidine(34) synthetase TilS [Ilumatobacteraceae bacterium]|nr:tRNA lysidine(34) synthetase TilS [Ilumatobacteraceae bacterium]